MGEAGEWGASGASERAGRVGGGEEAESEYQRIKRIRQENAENYRKQVEQSGEFVYNGHTDEIGQYEKEQRFVGLAIKTGMIEDFDDKF